MPEKNPHSKSYPMLPASVKSGLNAMLANSPLGFALLSFPERRYAYFNDALACGLGISASDAIGKTPEELFGTELIEKMATHVAAVVNSTDTQGQVEIDAEIPGRPGDLHTWRVQFHVVRTEAGVLTGIWYVVEDVTNERTYEQEMRDNASHLQGVLDVVPVGVLISDARGKLTYANNEAERIWGHALIESEGVPQYNSYELYHSDGRRTKPEESILARTLATGAALLKSRRLIKRPDGSWASVLCNSVPLRNVDGSLSGGIVAFWDVTELEQLQKRQQRLLEIAQAVNADKNLKDVLKMIRDAVVETTGFDRVGIWLYDEKAGRMRGAWGTDREGNAVDESAESYPMNPPSGHPLHALLYGEIRYYLTHEYHFLERPSSNVDMEGVGHHATFALAANDQTIGLMSVDNLITNRPITEDDLLPLLPFCEQAAAAIESARLREAERRQTAWWKEAVRITNHRVNNNLQVILATIETELLSDSAMIDRSTLERIKRQVHVISGVHERLGESEPELETTFRDILDNVMPMLQKEVAAECNVKCDEMVLTTKQATAAVLILHELICNSNQNGACHISISLTVNGDTVDFLVTDDGNGFPPGFCVNDDEHRGLGLVDRLARWNLLGTIGFSNTESGGASVAIQFKLSG